MIDIRIDVSDVFCNVCDVLLVVSFQYIRGNIVRLCLYLTVQSICCQRNSKTNILVLYFLF